MTDIVDAFEARIGLPLPQAAALREHIGRIVLRRGEVLFHQGSRHTRVYWMQTGVVKLSYTSPDGIERVRDFAVESKVFTCLEAFDGRQDTGYGATACEDCQLEWLDYAQLAPLGSRHPEWAQCLSLFAMDTARNRGERERILLTLTPWQRFQLAIEERPCLLERVTQRDLAAYIGVTPVSLSRFKSKLARQRR